MGFQYPHLNRLFPQDLVAALPQADHRHLILLGDYPERPHHLRRIDQALRFGETSGMLDKDSIERLTGADPDQFQATLNELLVGSFLQRIAPIVPRPQGRGPKIGEFELELAPPIFVEVKTLCDTDEERLRDKIWQKMRAIAHKVLSRFSLHVEITAVAPSITQRHFYAFLSRELGALKAKIPGSVGETIASLTYTENSGLCARIEVVYERETELPTSCSLSWAGFHSTHEHIISKVDEALKQLPNDKPNLIVICSASDIGTEHMDKLYALLGPLTVSINLQTRESRPYFPLKGIARPTIRTRISALGHFRSTPTPSGIEESMDLYHNPFADFPIDQNLMNKQGIRQFIKINENTMGWKD